MNRTIKIFSLLMPGLLVWSLVSCKKYLDLKPNKQLVLPQILADCQALLDNSIIMNFGYPAEGEVSADNYYLDFAIWNNQSTIDRNLYTWKADADVLANDWLLTYQKALYANQVLKTLGTISPSASEQADWNRIKASALFFRAFTYFQAAQIWTQPYNPSTAGTDPGIPLHLTPDVEEKAGRGTVKDTYDRILEDLNQAVGLLPNDHPTSKIAKSRPGLAATRALLARVYLVMGDYANALAQADLCIQNYGTLTNYNLVPAGSSSPFPKFNEEVIFESSTSYAGPLTPFYAKIAPDLYTSYGNTDEDLRKSLFFSPNVGPDAGTYKFVGSYEGSPYQFFCGIATDEVYLIRAECYARTGNVTAAMTDLNTLLHNRFKTPYTNKIASNADDALTQVLAERRKELPFRFLRWSDLRRLNKDPRFAVTLSRNLNGTNYTLPPNDLRYTLLIPREVITQEPMAQNPR